MKSANLKSCCEWCCLQIGSWYSSSSNTTGLPLVQELSWDCDDPSGLWRIWLLDKRHTSLEPPCSRTATTSGSLYRSPTTILRENLERVKGNKGIRQHKHLWKTSYFVTHWLEIWVKWLVIGNHIRRDSCSLFLINLCEFEEGKAIGRSILKNADYLWAV